MQSIFKPLLSEADEVNRCERFPLIHVRGRSRIKNIYITIPCTVVQKSAALIPAQIGIFEAN